MNRRRYELPYEDPGQRRPWVPYHEYIARREAERLRVPGVFRNDRARRADDVRAGVRFPREARFQQERGRMLRRRMQEQDFDAEQRAEYYQRQVRDRKDKLRRMHRDADAIYAVGAHDPEAEFDALHGDWGGRYEEFVITGVEEEPEEAFKRVREDDITSLPVIDPKKVKFVED